MNTDQWKTFKERVTESGWMAVASAAGFDVSGKSPTSAGWINGLLVPGTDDKNPSCGVNIKTGKVDDKRDRFNGDLLEFIQQREGLDFNQASDRIGSIVSGPSAVQIEVESSRKPPRPVHESNVDKWSKLLLSRRSAQARAAYDYLTTTRGINEETLKRYRVGFHVFRKDNKYPDAHFWITFPVHQHETGGYTIKRVAFDPGPGVWLRDNGKKIEKTWGGGSWLILSNEAETSEKPVVVCAGETDFLTAVSAGLNAVSGSAGENTFKSDWGRLISELPGAQDAVYVFYDGDAAGRRGAQLAAGKIAQFAGSVYIVPTPEGQDMNSLYLGGKNDSVCGLIEQAAPYEPLKAGQGDGQQGEPPGTPVARDEFTILGKVIKKPRPGPDDYWFYVKEKKSGRIYLDLKIDMPKILRHIEKMGWRKAYIGGINTSTLLKADGNILDETSEERVKDALFEDLEGRANKTDLHDKLVKTSHIYCSRRTLECLEPMTPDFKRGTPSTSHFFYRNGFVRVTADKREFLPYSELDGHVWKKQVIDRDVRLEEDDSKLWESVIMRFWRLAMGNTGDETGKRLQALMTAIGYILHDYKDKALARAIVFIDEAISDSPNGGAGKTLTVEACRNMTAGKHIDSRNFKFDSTFAFQEVDPSHRFIHFNDCPPKFPFERLFSVITEGLEIEKKGQPRITLSFDDSPKIILSTNYIIEGRGGSHKRRVHEIEFTDYFNAQYEPKDEFNHRFFDDWTADEWHLFDNVMMGCVSLYLRQGLTGYEQVNIIDKQLISQTSPEFYEYLQFFPVEPGRAVYPSTVRDKFLEAKDIVNGWEGYPKLEDSVSSQKIKKWLKIYGQLMGWTVADSKDMKDSNGRYIQFSEPVLIEPNESHE